VRRRLILSTALIALAAVVVLGVPLGAVEAARVRADSASRLEREADAAAGVSDDRIEAHQLIPPRVLARVMRPGHRIVVVTDRGVRAATGPPLRGPIQIAHSGSQLGGSVTAEAPAAELDQRIHRTWLVIAALSGGGVLIAIGLAALQARRLARPLETIARRSALLGDGDFSVRVGRFGIPEVDAIAQSLDSSAERIAELVAREREFSANVSHQLRTPLTALRLRLEQVQATRDAARRRDGLEAALAEADRIEATITDLLRHAGRVSAEGRAVVNIGSVLHDHAGAWRPVFARAQRQLDVRVPKNTLAHVSRGTAGQVLGVLLDNALHHGGGAVSVDVTVEHSAVVIAVADEGPGVPADARESIFERGASHAGGTGIGLHLARALAEADGGALRLAGADASRFELRLPLSDGTTPPPA
jgi:signal transduction histidine kinase